MKRAALLVALTVVLGGCGGRSPEPAPPAPQSTTTWVDLNNGTSVRCDGSTAVYVARTAKGVGVAVDAGSPRCTS